MRIGDKVLLVDGRTVELTDRTEDPDGKPGWNWRLREYNEDGSYFGSTMSFAYDEEIVEVKEPAPDDYVPPVPPWLR